ncbi:MAG: hypothetical protein RL272_876 [Candidatus Parcubacteria bacterium]|jgi:hypothetical protein
MSQLVRWDAKKGATFVHSLSLSLDKETADRVGRVYGIIAADTKGRKGEALAAHLEDAFTRGAAEAVRKLPGDAPQDQLFEAAIARTNHALNRLFGEYGLDVEPERVTSAIIAVRDHDVVAATWGKPTVLLYHPLPNGRAKVLDLVDDSRAEAAAPFKTANVRRCFGSIIAGRMGKRDRLLLSSQDLRPCLGDEKIEATVVANDPASATAVLNQLLEPIHEAIAVAALVVDVAEIRYVESDPSLAPAAKAAPASATSASIAKLLKTQSETVETMAPTLMGGIGKTVTGLFSHAPQAAAPAQKPPAAPASQTPSPAKVPQARPKSAAAAAYVAEGAKAAARGAMIVLRAIWSFLAASFNGEKRRDALRSVRERTDRAMNGLIDRFNALTALSRILLFAALSLVLVAKGGVFIAALNRAKEERIAVQERALTGVQQKIDSAEASMIYRDEARARQLLADATAATDALPEKKPAEQQAKEGLRKKIAAAFDELRHEVRLGQPELVANITSGTGTPSLAKLAAADGVLWSVSSKGEIFKVTAADGAADKVADAPGGAVPAIFFTIGKDVFAAAQDGAGKIVTLAGKTNARTVDFKGADSAVSDAGVYNARMYVLDAAHNRIMRHPAVDAGFGQAQFYLKDGTDLSQAVSMAIDGSVYVLRKDGSIAKIVRGLQETFAVSPADPPVTAPLRLRTEENSDLFVLDSSPARILRYNKKTGVLMAQYASDSLKGATDFTIDAKGTTATVAVNNQVIRFALPDEK